jgi:hypothetical protein
MAKTLTLTRTAGITLAGWAAASGSLTSPPAPFSTVAQTAVIPAGTYTVQWTVSLSGTVGAPEANNFILNLGPATFLAASVNAAAAGTYAQAPVTFTTPGGLRLLILSGGSAATAGAVYSGSFTGQGIGTAQLGPTSPGEIWRPAQVSVSCSATVTAGVCQCSIYAGAAVGQPTFVDGTFSGDTGDTTDAIGGRVVNPGESVFAVWQGGVAGSTASLVVSGTRTVP